MSLLLVHTTAIDHQLYTLQKDKVFLDLALCLFLCMSLVFSHLDLLISSKNTSRVIPIRQTLILLVAAYI